MAVGLGNIRCSSSFDHASELLCLPPCVPLIEGSRKPTPTLKTPAPTRGLTFNFYQRSVTGYRALYDALIQGIHDEHGKLKFLLIWSMIFVMSCVIAVSLDPLFLYILIIDEDNKCLQMDKKLSTIVLLLRSLTDIFFAVDFIYKTYDSVASNTPKLVGSSTLQTETSIQTGGNLDRNSEGRVFIEVGKKRAQMSWLSFSIINDFLALLPIPQLLIVATFHNMRGAEYVEHRKVLNVFILGQYLPRIYRIHRSSKEIRKNTGILCKGLFKFFLYILASHMLGAFWYFFSIQRETSCWHSACANHSPDPIGCMDAFYCGRRTTTSRNITFLNEHCPLEIRLGVLPPFNFGIFLDSLKNNNSKRTTFGKKFLYSFWWGMQNLSNFGTNLTTSTYVWENLFAILISAIGLLMFLFNFGIVQTLMMKSEEIERMIRMKKQGVREWISRNEFPDDIKNEIMKSTEQILTKNKDANVDNPFLILPWQTKRSVKRYLFMGTLKKVAMLQRVDEKVLMLICDYLMPVTYSENSFVFRMGDPLDFMLFIIDGAMWSYASSDSQAGNGTSSMATKPLEKGQFYGEELLEWALDGFTKIPVSSKYVKCLTKVEAFVLMAKDLQTVVSKVKQYWDYHNCKNPEEVAISTNRWTRFHVKVQRRLVVPRLR